MCILGDDLAAHLVRESADTISFTLRRRFDLGGADTNRARGRMPGRWHLPGFEVPHPSRDRHRGTCRCMRARRWIEAGRIFRNCLKPWCFPGLSATGTCTARTCRSTTPTVFGNPLRFTTYSAPSPIHAGEIPWRSTSTVAPTGSSRADFLDAGERLGLRPRAIVTMIDAVVEAAQDWPDKCGEIGFDDHQTTLLEKMLRTRIDIEPSRVLCTPSFEGRMARWRSGTTRHQGQGGAAGPRARR